MWTRCLTRPTAQSSTLVKNLAGEVKLHPKIIIITIIIIIMMMIIIMITIIIIMMMIKVGKPT